MAVPVPFGQYVPAESPVHRLDPRVKIVVTGAFTAALFLVDSWAGMAAVAVVAVAAVAISGVSLRLAARGLLPIVWLLGFTLIFNALWPAMRSQNLLVLGPLRLDEAGLLRGLFFAVRIVVLVLGTSLVTLTTSPVALTDALSSLMRPLRYVRVPVDDAAMMLSIALRFIPTTAEEAERIVIAQTARGAAFDSRGPIRRARAWAPVLIPLFVRLFKRADDLALAMESRCYRGLGRTRLRELAMRGQDWAVLAGGVTLAALLGILG